MEQNYERKNVDLSNGETYSYIELGDSSKKTLILIHGNASSGAFFDLLFEGLKNDFRIVAPDLRGYGHTTYNTPFDSLEELADDLKLFVDALSIKSFALFGWSLGGGVVMKFAAKYSSYVEALILHNSMGLLGNEFFKMDASFKFTTERCLTKEEIKSHVLTIMAEKRNADKNTAQMIQALKIGVWNGLKVPDENRLKLYGDEGVLQRCAAEALYALNLTFNMSDQHNGIIDGTGEYKNIKCKILAFAGKKDILVKYSHAEDMKAKFGDQIKLITFEDSGHSAMEDHTEEVVKAIVDFAK